MKLIDLKLKPKSKLRNAMATVAEEEPDSGPAYPWGLEVNLETETIEKLGIDMDNIKAGDTVHIVAKAEVTTVSIRQTTKRKGNDKLNKSLSLQLTDMQLGGSKDSFE
jgi:hypothetical protein